MEAFCEGYRAGLVGPDPRMCPYEKLTKEWVEWQRGYGVGADLVASADFELIDDDQPLRRPYSSEPKPLEEPWK